eukprot:CAMPEP_0113634052 /NCGR_PEP_ID=MMETSP0017_2-20120614/17729_1 /TAXON_ID=2856 /ORGANISM="Cylindrotheca closterium" /LENGTH=267 /DNA_ID=CAMNT_0000544731 /DNA_START=60 /DNA_END=860 /DNA_ORIENTATION=+ /assembly_acc=CAM_ASM_000147
MDFSDDYARSAPWEKVTRKVIDPITFACTASIEYRPHLEECAFETTGPPISEPRFGDVFKRSTRRGIAPPAWSPPSNRTPTTTTTRKATQQQPAKKAGSNSLGAFFQKSSAVQKKQDADNMSVGSRSIASRSVADLSIAERSKTEDKLKRKAKNKKQKSARKLFAEQKHKEMNDIMEDDAPTKPAAVSEPPAPPETPKHKPKSCFPQKFKYAIDDDKDDDEKSLTLEDVRTLRFGEGHEEFEIDRITGSMYDDLFYGSEELADFRYE